MMTPLQRARASLEGLSVGDGFGEKFFFSYGVREAIEERRPPTTPWFWTDDTAMALSIYDCLETHGQIVSDDLAQRFAKRYINDPMRGYGEGMRQMLNDIARGKPWREVSVSAFGGTGSWGNGAAMRVAPIGAYFADRIELVVEQAMLSARVTHAHPEAVAGAIAVAVAAALAVRHKAVPLERRAFIQQTADLTPESEVRSKLLLATKFTDQTPIETAIFQLGCGWDVSAQDTVPFCIWCAAKNLENFVEGLWYTVSALGDRDTTCAIVGGIIAANTGIEGIPQAWSRAREDLPVWGE